MKKVLLLIFPNFAEFEITVATSLLRANHQVVTVALQKDPLAGESGLQFLPHLAISEVNPDEYEAIIVPGGDLEALAEAYPLFALVQAMQEKGKIVAAICSGGFVVAKAGLLEKRPYTVTLSSEQRRFLGIPETGFRYEPLIEVDNIITAQGHAYVEFGLRVAERLGIQNIERARHFFTGKGNQVMEVGLYKVESKDEN
ncbi:MAG TPA: DJ-1/PfpI family protein [Chloroflexia bacterium]|nr:DJ-1/PfpI family protein [Chloroflexia bacterium]